MIINHRQINRIIIDISPPQKTKHPVKVTIHLFRAYPGTKQQNKKSVEDN